MAVLTGCFSASRRAPLEGTPFQLERVTVVNVREVTEEQERLFGYYMDAMAQQWWPILEPEHPLTIGVDRVGQRLARISDRPDLKHTFKVINNPGWANAVAVPGGFIYVTTALIKILETEDELAAVLAHEIGHVTARHRIKKLHSSQQWARINKILVDAIVEGATAAAGQAVKSATGLDQIAKLAGRAAGTTAGGLAAGISEVIEAVMLSAYSREHEREADGLGLRYLKLAGYQATGLVSVLSKMDMLATRERSGQGIFATHPSPVERRNTILQYLRAHE